VSAFALLAEGIGLPHAFVFAGVQETHAQILGEHALSAIVALGLLLPAVFPADGRGGVRAFLLRRPVVWLGVVSYGIYLYHDPIAIHLADTLDIGSRAATFLVILVLTATLAIACAAVSYRSVERPFLRRK
jgi:peptidoglycan/LPS O-acetylase OafA/YrhL